LIWHKRRLAVEARLAGLVADVDMQKREREREREGGRERAREEEGK